MIHTLYIEEAIRAHPRVRAIVERFARATIVPITRYGEVFNRNQQSFRLQKKNPALILAEKKSNQVLSAPEGYGIGSARNFYFSHVLNCLYDCRYCFLQGMYRSAHYVLFVNYEDFQDQIIKTVAAHPGEDVYFFSGYDGDSLALESITGFVEAFLPFMTRHPRAVLELRTKSAAVRALLNHEPLENVVVAFSFTPDAASEALEHGVPPIAVRLKAMARLAESGFQLGLRFDPLLYAKDYRDHYRGLFRKVLGAINVDVLHSVSFGPFRMPRAYFQRMRKLYPEEKLFSGPLDESEVVSYPSELESEMRVFCEEELSQLVPASILFPCRV